MKDLANLGHGQKLLGVGSLLLVDVRELALQTVDLRFEGRNVGLEDGVSVAVAGKFISGALVSGARVRVGGERALPLPPSLLSLFAASTTARASPTRLAPDARCRAEKRLVADLELLRLLGKSPI